MPLLRPFPLRIVSLLPPRAFFAGWRLPGAQFLTARFGSPVFTAYMYSTFFAGSLPEK